MTDLLAQWWVHPCQVERPAIGNAYTAENTFTAPETIVGFYSDKTSLVGGPNGTQTASTGRFAFPSGVAYVPVGSRVTLPAVFGSRVMTVVASAVGNGGGQPTPDHQEIACL